MNTVDALKDLYKTLCGKDYAGDPNPTDAEMISAIAKDATGGGSGGGGGKIIMDVTDVDNPIVTPLATGLSMEELVKYQVVSTRHNVDYILTKDSVTANKGSAVVITTIRHPEDGESVRITYETSDSVNTYIATAIAISSYEATIEFEKGVISFGDRSDTFTAAADDGQVSITIVKNQPDEMITEGVMPIISAHRSGNDGIFSMAFIGYGQLQALSYNSTTGEVDANLDILP